VIENAEEIPVQYPSIARSTESGSDFYNLNGFFQIQSAGIIELIDPLNFHQYLKFFAAPRRFPHNTALAYAYSLRLRILRKSIIPMRNQCIQRFARVASRSLAHVPILGAKRFGNKILKLQRNFDGALEVSREIPEYNYPLLHYRSRSRRKESSIPLIDSLI